jgi:hypothetical protein
MPPPPPVTLPQLPPVPVASLQAAAAPLGWRPAQLPTPLLFAPATATAAAPSAPAFFEASDVMAGGGGGGGGGGSVGGGRGGGSVARSRDHAAGVEAAGETTEEKGSNAIVPPAPPLPSAMEVDGASLEDEAENDRTGRVEPVALTAPAPAEASMCALCSAVLFGAAVTCNKCHSSFHAACVKRGAQHVHKAFMCDACLAAKPPPDAQALAATGTAKRAKTNKGKVADFHKRALGAMV